MRPNLNGLLSCLLVITFSFEAAYSQHNKIDSLDIDSTSRFEYKQLILPASLIAVGAYGISNGWLKKVKNDTRDGFTDLRGNHYFHIDDYIQYLPIAANVGLAFAGAKAKHSFTDRLLTTSTAYIAMAITVNLTKVLVTERRPDTGARKSFPSGHTATAFMGAELTRIEYGNLYGLGAYVIAVGVGVLRMYNDRHWLNDVIAGAGFGILSARIGYWLLPFERKLFKLDKSKKQVLLLPSYHSETSSIGMSLSLTL